jgi:hypothetical protein
MEKEHNCHLASGLPYQLCHGIRTLAKENTMNATPRHREIDPVMSQPRSHQPALETPTVPAVPGECSAA